MQVRGELSGEGKGGSWCIGSLVDQREGSAEIGREGENVSLFRECVMEGGGRGEEKILWPKIDHSSETAICRRREKERSNL